MILTVTLNPALDVTYHVDAITPGTAHRVSRVDERAGGKGVNVARVLAQLGVPVLATGLLGGANGERARGLLEGLPSDFGRITGETRRTVVVTDGHEATGFWEPGPAVSAPEWTSFLLHFEQLAGRASAVVCSGSLPEGAPVDAYAQLITLAREAGALTVLDTSGPALPAGLAARPDLVKPNAAELRELALPIPDGVVLAASDGPDGLTLTCADGVWRGRPPERIAGNPTGAGDACVAALARGLSSRTAPDWSSLVRDAVALSAAAVASPVAGVVDLELYQRLVPLIEMEER